MASSGGSKAVTESEGTLNMEERCLLQPLLTERENVWHEKLATVKRDVVDSLEKLQREMESNFKQQLDNKETQLYTVMHERLEIQKNFYVEQLAVQARENQTRLNELEDMTSGSSSAKETEIQDLKKQLASVKNDYEKASQKYTELKKENQLLQVYGETTKDKELVEMSRERTELLAADYKKATEKYAKLWAESLQMEDKYDRLKENYRKLHLKYSSMKEEREKLLKELSSKVEEKDRDGKMIEEYKKKYTTLEEQLQSAKADLHRYKQITDYLVDQHSPDMRPSLAGCANEEFVWSQLEKELKAIPSRCAQLEKENQLLKQKLTTATSDLERLIIITPGRPDSGTPQDPTTSVSEFKMPQPPHQNRDFTESRSTNGQALKMSGQRGTPGSCVTPAKGSLEHVPEPEKENSGRSVNLTSSRQTHMSKVRTVRSKKTERGSSQKSSVSSVPTTPAPETRKPSRRKLFTLHPALDHQDEEAAVDCSLPQSNSLEKTKRHLRTTYKQM